MCAGAFLQGVSLAGDPQVSRLTSSARCPMRNRPRISALVLTFVLACVLAEPARAQFDGLDEGQVLRNAQMVTKLLASRARRLGTSAGPDPDTVYVGKSHTNHTDR